ncbi:MAG: 30S ribosome-binding factor RbfA [Butyrivibrio sp.]|nr:30S ribosome-binding factor RbfA [Butyrivibrio sp.]
MRKNSIKNIRINGEVQRVVAEAIRSSKDPRISPLTSVMDVNVAPDLKTCKIRVSVMGSDEDRRRTEEGLKSASGYIRSTLAHELNMRYTPQITFIMDDSIEYAIRMSRKIDEVAAADRAAQEARNELPEEESE